MKKVLKIKKDIILAITFFGIAFFSYHILSSSGKVYLNADAYGYLYPALEYNDSGNLKLIYGRPFLWPFILSLYPFKYFENFAIIINSLLLASLAIPIASLAIESVENSKSFFIYISAIISGVVGIISIYDNVNILQWYFFILPEGFVITVSCWVLYLVSLILFRDASRNRIIIVTMLSVVLFYAKPAYLLYSLLATSICIVKILTSKEKVRWKILMLLGMAVPTIFLVCINTLLVDKFDRSGSNRFKYATIICFNAPAVYKQISEKYEKNWVDASLTNRLGAVISRGGGYGSLGYNPDECLYSSKFNLYQDIDAKLGWNVTPNILKPYSYLVFNEYNYLLKRIAKQYLVGLEYPIYNSNSKYLDDKSILEFNREGLRNTSSDVFWDSHQWDLSTVIQAIYTYKISGVVYLAIIFALILIIELFHRGSWKSCLLLVILVLSAMLVTSIAAIFDVERYRDTMVPLFIFLLYIMVIKSICFCNKILNKKF